MFKDPELNLELECYVCAKSATIVEAGDENNRETGGTLHTRVSFEVNHWVPFSRVITWPSYENEREKR